MKNLMDFVDTLSAFEYGLKSGMESKTSFDEDYPFEMQIKRAKTLIRDAVIFEVDETIKISSALHKAPKLRYDFLPHQTMFLDVAFDVNEFDELKKKKIINITGILLTKSPLVNDKIHNEVVGEAINAISICRRNEMVWLDSMTFNHKITNEKYKSYKSESRKIPENRFIENFIYNILNFINDPETKLIKIDRSQKNMVRRAKRGKTVIPSSIQIKLTGSTKVYVDQFHKKIKSGEAKWHYNYRFPVRSHVRHYRDKTGAVIKEVEIKEYTKGNGPLVDKRYSLEG
jgi:hypothetical protein